MLKPSCWVGLASDARTGARCRHRGAGGGHDDDADPSEQPSRAQEPCMVRDGAPKRDGVPSLAPPQRGVQWTGQRGLTAVQRLLALPQRRTRGAPCPTNSPRHRIAATPMRPDTTTSGGSASSALGDTSNGNLFTPHWDRWLRVPELVAEAFPLWSALLVRLLCNADGVRRWLPEGFQHVIGSGDLEPTVICRLAATQPTIPSFAAEILSTSNLHPHMALTSCHGTFMTADADPQSPPHSSGSVQPRARLAAARPPPRPARCPTLP